MERGPGRFRESSYRQLLRVHSKSFRERHGSELIETFRDAWRDRAANRGLLAGIRFWWWLAVGEARAGLGDRLRERRSGAASGALHGVVTGLGGDLRSALRQFRSAPRVHVGATVLLGVGLAAAVWAWGMSYGAYGHGLPVAEPDRMLALQRLDPITKEQESFSFDDGVFLTSEVPDLSGEIGLWTQYTVDLAGDDRPPERIGVLETTPAMFRLLQLSPLQGRLLTESDADPANPEAVVLGHRFWERRYDADPSVIGRTVDVDGRPVVVVGILPAGARLEFEDVWLAAGRADRASHRYAVLLRRPAGIGTAGLSAQLQRFGDRLPGADADTTLQAELRPIPFAESFRGSVGNIYLWVVGWAGALLLVMALANVANLFLVRARVQTRELAVRRALGANRLQIMRKIGIETAVPMVPGTFLAAILAGEGLSWYQRASEAYAGGLTPVWQVYRLELPHLFVLAAVALVSVMLIGLLAGFEAVRRDGGMSLRSERGVTASRFYLGRALVGLEIAVAAALFLIASLMLRSTWNLHTIDWGFARDDVLTGHVMLDESRYAEPDDRLRFWSVLETRLAETPGITSVTLATQLPMIRYAARWRHLRGIEVEGEPLLDPASLEPRYVDAIASSFFETFERPVLAGRAFTASDNAASDPVAIVNAPFVAERFGRQNPIGRRIRFWTGDEPGPWLTVIGIAPDLWMDTDEDRDPEGVYVPLAQVAPPEASIAIRVTGPPGDKAATLRDAIHALDPQLPVTDLMTMPELIRYRTQLYRRNDPPLIWIGLASLLLAVAGLYAVVSYIASLRTREFGIRSAIGATRTDLVARSLAAEIPPVLIGSLVGVVAGLALVRGFARFLFQVQPSSPAVSVASVAVLIATTVAASMLPVLRASRVDLVRVLGSD